MKLGEARKEGVEGKKTNRKPTHEQQGRGGNPLELAKLAGGLLKFNPKPEQRAAPQEVYGAALV